MGFRCKGAEYNRLNEASAAPPHPDRKKAMSTRDIILAHPVRTAIGAYSSSKCIDEFAA